MGYMTAPTYPPSFTAEEPSDLRRAICDVPLEVYYPADIDVVMDALNKALRALHVMSNLVQNMASDLEDIGHPDDFAGKVRDEVEYQVDEIVSEKLGDDFNKLVEDLKTITITKRGLRGERGPQGLQGLRGVPGEQGQPGLLSEERQQLWEYVERIKDIEFTVEEVTAFLSDEE